MTPSFLNINILLYRIHQPFPHKVLSFIVKSFCSVLKCVETFFIGNNWDWRPIWSVEGRARGHSLWRLVIISTYLISSINDWSPLSAQYSITIHTRPRQTWCPPINKEIFLSIIHNSCWIFPKINMKIYFEINVILLGIYWQVGFNLTPELFTLINQGGAG